MNTFDIVVGTTTRMISATSSEIFLFKIDITPIWSMLAIVYVLTILTLVIYPKKDEY